GGAPAVPGVFPGALHSSAHPMGHPTTMGMPRCTYGTIIGCADDRRRTGGAWCLPRCASFFNAPMRFRANGDPPFTHSGCPGRIPTLRPAPHRGAHDGMTD